MYLLHWIKFLHLDFLKLLGLNEGTDTHYLFFLGRGFPLDEMSKNNDWLLDVAIPVTVQYLSLQWGPMKSVAFVKNSEGMNFTFQPNEFWDLE